MCFEDVQIGRATQSFRRSFIPTTAGIKLLPNNPQRFSVIIAAPSSGVIWVEPGAPAIAGQGYALSAGDDPIHLRLQHDGQIVTGEWWAIADAGNGVVAVFETWFRPGSDEFPSKYPGGGP